MIGNIREHLNSAIERLKQQQQISLEQPITINIESTRNSQHGDYACNIALTLAKPLRQNPRQIAEMIVTELEAVAWLEKVEIAGPGFINFYLSQSSRQQVIEHILSQGACFGNNKVGEQKTVNVEFVSANPTGPLHVGHGRGAAFGASLSKLLSKSGYQVHSEYYVNDYGRQMDILAVSVWLRYLELFGESLTFPSNGYKGKYIFDIAETIKQQHQDSFFAESDSLFSQVCADEPQGGDKEKHIDDLIAVAKKNLGTSYFELFNQALQSILQGIKQDLKEFQVEYQQWFSEKSLHQSDTIDRALDKLDQAGHLYKKDGALWFKSSAFGDDKDRVVERENGAKTYFASDIAYLLNKFERGFEQVIYIFGADHHGYIVRLKAAATAMGLDADKITILLVQFAHLFENQQKLQMSTRSGEFVTLKQLIDEVGSDAARFFYIMRSHEQHLDFDLDLAKSQSNDNPVYYIQYAHARICSIFRKLEAQQLSHDQVKGNSAIDKLTENQEQELITQLSRYPEVIKKATQKYSVHGIANYLRELAQLFHSYYNAHQVVTPDEALRNARLNLCQAVQRVLADGLSLIGASAPKQMNSNDKRP